LPTNAASSRVAGKVGLSFERELHLEGVFCHLYSGVLSSAPMPPRDPSIHGA